MTDLRDALRGLVRSPGFTLSAIIALALGIGANTAVFSLIYAALLAPLPYPQPDRLVALSERSPDRPASEPVVSAGTFIDWRARSHLLDGVAVYAPLMAGEVIWNVGDRAQMVRSTGASPSLFAVLGVRPIVGRELRAENVAAPAGALGEYVISYALWQRVFGGAADIIGRTVTLEGRLPREIVGVMPPGFDFPDGTEAWTSVPLPSVEPPSRRARSFRAVGRLAPAATVDDLRRELSGISAQLAAEYPQSNAGWTAAVDRLAPGGVASSRTPLLVLMAAVAGVLLIACANVAILLLARAASRRGELAVRMALGATGARLVRQCLAEASLLCAAGTIAGLAAAEVIARILVRLAPPDFGAKGAEISGATVLFAAGACGLCVALVGAVSAMETVRAAARSGLRPDLRAATAYGVTTRRWLVGAEAAVVVMLLAAALLLVRTFVKLRHVDLGFETAHTFAVETRWPIGYLMQAAPGTRPWSRVQHATDGLLAAVQSVPGIEAAGLATDLPLAAQPFDTTIWRLDAPGATLTDAPPPGRDRWQADVSFISVGYLRAMNIPVLRGRAFDERDRFGDDVLLRRGGPAPVGVALVNEAFASRYFAGADPLGQVIVLGEDREFGAARTIVGVTSDFRQRAVGELPQPTVFVPLAQHPDLVRPSLIVRTSMPAAAVAPAIRDRLAAFDPQLVVLRIQPMAGVVAGTLSKPRFNLLLVSAFAGVALLLAAVGIYGVLSYVVSARTREIGIRMALGARAADVLRLVTTDGMTPVVVGAAAGLGAAALVTRAARSMLYGVSPLDPVSFAAAPMLLVVVALAASYLPSRRATAVDPLVALREE